MNTVLLWKHLQWMVSLGIHYIFKVSFGMHHTPTICLFCFVLVRPKLLINDTVKSFMMVKAGDTIRVRIPFEVRIAHC